jgi:hypothetical protein
MNAIKSGTVKLKAKRTFIKQGTCSRTFFYLLDREFGHAMEMEEQAADPLAGGIIQQGYQCGMLWGAALAVGAEAYRRTDNQDQAIALSIKATQRVMVSFVNRTGTIQCEEITRIDFNNKWSLAKFMLSGKFVSCITLCGKWAPEAIQAAIEGLSTDESDSPQHCLSCSSEVVKKMGGSDEEIAMVAGLAGGLGLSGSGCGALASAIWKTILELIKTNGWKYSMSDPVTEKILKKFYEATNYEMECSEITGLSFETLDEHTEFIKNGGCRKLIDVMAG